MAKKSPIMERKDKEKRMEEKVHVEVAKLLKKYGKFSEKEIKHVVYKKWIHETIASGDCSIFLGLYFKENEEAYKAVVEKIESVMQDYYGSKANYQSEAPNAYSIQIGQLYYRANSSNKACDMQRVCMKEIAPIVEAAIAPIVTDIKEEPGKSYGLKDACKVGFNLENFARTYAGPKVIVFANDEDFVDSTIRGSLHKAVESIQSRQSAGEESSSVQ